MNGDRVSDIFIAALDIGSSNLKCDIINASGNVVGRASRRVALINPNPGWVEIEPDALFESIVEVVKEAIKNANTTAARIKSIGISTQRCTFVTWKKDTGEYLHNFITWQDLRTEKLLESLNRSLSYRLLQWASYGVYFFTRIQKFKLASQLKITTRHITGRLLWVINNMPEVKEHLKSGNLMFGTLDTWLIYKLTGGKSYVTDISNASASGLFDSFALNWSIIAKFFNIPLHIMPKVVSNDFDFGVTAKELFGEPIKIGCVLADQSSSMFGSCCFQKNDLKLTMGTGAFLDVNTDTEIYPSLNGMYPLICWKIKNEVKYMLEVPCLEVGALFDELQKHGIIESPRETSNIAYEVGNCAGIYFIHDMPVKEQYEGDTFSSKFVGTKENTTERQKIRATLEGIVFNIVTCLNLLKTERNEFYHTINVDGGVANNDFICQMLADLSNLPVVRLISTDISTFGAAYAAGIITGVWKDQQTIKSLQVVDRVFKPSESEEFQEELKKCYQEWLDIGRY